jgi:sugar phosphate isomerase/epimerase
MLQLAKRLGYDGIELRTVCDHAHKVELESDAAARRAAKAMAAERGVALCCVATSCCYADPAKAAKNVEDTLGYIDLAADIGSPCIRVFGGPVAKGLDRDAAIRLVAQSLSAVADRAQKRNVTVCMETHDDWCNPDHVAEVMRKVNHPSIAVNWDIMHPVRVAKSTMDQAYKALQPWIRHIHFHDGATVDGKCKLVPIGEGEIDHRRAVQLLKTGAYGGYLSGEWIGWEPYETHLPRELATMKRYDQEAS